MKALRCSEENREVLGVRKLLGGINELKKKMLSALGVCGLTAFSLGMNGAASAATTGSPTFTSSVTESPSTVTVGGTSTITATFNDTSGSLSNGILDIEVYNSSGTKVGQQTYSGVNLSSGQSDTQSFNWTTPSTPGTYTVEVGVFNSNWSTAYYWNNSAGSVQVSSNPTFSDTTSVSPGTITPGQTSTITTTLHDTGGSLSNGVLDIEVHDSSGNKVGQQTYSGVNLSSGQSDTQSFNWTAPSTPGTYTVTVGVFNSNWSTSYYWDNNAGSVQSSNPLVANMAPGWNLGNTLDATPTETSWGNPLTTQSMIDAVAQSGFKSIRIPVTWYPHMGPGPTYTVDPTWMSRVKQVIQYALNDNLYVVVNVHHDSWDWITKATTTAQFNANMTEFETLWSQIAQALGGFDNRVIFEVCNEPGWQGTSDGLTADQEDEQMNTDALNTIRGTGGLNATRLVMLSPIGDNPGQLDSDAQYFLTMHQQDPNTIATIHYYSPWGFLNNWWDETTWGSTTDKQNMYNDLDGVYTDLVQKGMPVVIGEYAAFESIQDRFSKVYYQDYLNKLAHQFGMPTMWWDAGGDFNRNTLQWNYPTMKDIVVNEANGIQNSFVNPLDVYLNANSSITNQTLSLELNGNSITSITNGGYTLKAGTDYSVNTSNNTLTLNASYLSTAVTQGQLGINADLTVSFSAGASEVIHVIQYTNPSVTQTTISLTKPSGGFTSQLDIPVTFNGTSLQTVAAYDSSQPSGPYPEYSWTPYLEEVNGSGDFSSDASNVYLTTQFLNSLTPGHSYVVTLYFWPNGVSQQLTLQIQ